MIFCSSVCGILLLTIKLSVQPFISISNAIVLVIYLTVIHIKLILIQQFYKEPLLLIKSQAFKFRNICIYSFRVYLITDERLLLHFFPDDKEFFRYFNFMEAVLYSTHKVKHPVNLYYSAPSLPIKSHVAIFYFVAPFICYLKFVSLCNVN